MAPTEQTVDFVPNNVDDLRSLGINSPKIVDDHKNLNPNQFADQHSKFEPAFPTFSDVTDEILLIIENKLRETIGRTLHRDVLEEIHEELYDLLRDWQEQLESKSD